MEITWSKTAQEIIAPVSFWSVFSNWLSIFECHVQRPREWRLPPPSLEVDDWMSAKYSSPLEIGPIIQELRERTSFAFRSTESAGGAKLPPPPPKIGEEIGLTALGAGLWDYLTRIVYAERYKRGIGTQGMDSTLALGPYCPVPTRLLSMSAGDEYNITNLNATASGVLARKLCYIDSPMHTIKLMEVDSERDMISKEPGNLGQLQMGVARSQKAADFHRLYRLQATLGDLGMVWPLYEIMAEIARKHGSMFANEVDAARPVAEELLSYRHPMIRLLHGSMHRMTAQTPDGPAKVIPVSRTLYDRLSRTEPDASVGWIQIFGEMRELASKSILSVQETRAPVAGWPVATLVDVLEFLHRMRPVLTARGDSMKRMSSELWGGGSDGEPFELSFNSPPIALTDGISAGTTAQAAVGGMRQLIPIYGPALRYYIAREKWTWNEFGVVPVEREEAPGDYISPPDGMPRDIMPGCCLMGEPGAIEQPAESIVARLEQYGMLTAVETLAGVFGQSWPAQPGDQNWVKNNSPDAVPRVDEAIGSFVVVADEAQLQRQLINGTDDLKARMLKGRYYVRPDGFAGRAVVRRTHPREFRYVVNHAIMPQKMNELWYADWPVRAEDMRMTRSLTAGVTSTLHSSFPSLGR